MFILVSFVFLFAVAFDFVVAVLARVVVKFCSAFLYVLDIIIIIILMIFIIINIYCNLFNIIDI
jgi:hypothetical protein